MWWIYGWVIFCFYLIFSLDLYHRLTYFFKPSRAKPADNTQLRELIDSLGKNAGLNITDVRVAKARDDALLPPAFAFGHKNNVRLFFRRDIYERLSPINLQAIAAHALARNSSHMYLQAWLICAAAGFIVFAFLAWFAPQSWFLDEIGLRVYGPGPYYGSVLTFAIVALPVLLFPFRLPLDAFLRHLIFASDTFAMKHTGLKSTVNALIELIPAPMRHSSVTLGFFDLLFSHEPSLMARITKVQHNYAEFEEKRRHAAKRAESLQVKQQLENVTAALNTLEKENAQENTVALASAEKEIHSTDNLELASQRTPESTTEASAQSWEVIEAPESTQTSDRTAADNAEIPAQVSATEEKAAPAPLTRRQRALKIMAQRQRELFEKTQRHGR